MLRGRKAFNLTAIFVIAALLAGVIFGFSANADDGATAEIELFSMVIGEKYSMHFALDVNGTVSPSSIGVEVRIGSPDNENVREAIYKENTAIDGEDRLVYAYEHIGATQLALDLYVTPYVVSGGERVYGEMKKISALEYAYKVLGRIGEPVAVDPAVEERLGVMLLNGAASQLNSDTNTDRLPTDDYAFVRLVGGRFASDGFAKHLVKIGESAPVVANQVDGKCVLGWSDSSGNTVSELEAWFVSPTQNETYTVKYGAIERSISYDAMGGVLPEGLPESYIEAEGNTLLAEPTREGYRFGGWYTSTEFKKEDCVTSVGEKTRGDLTLYAKWGKIISSLDGDQIYAKGNQTLNATSDTGEVKNGFTTSDSVLVWTQGDSIRSQMAMNGKIYAASEGEYAITYEITMAKSAGKLTVPGQFRIRRSNASFVSVINPFTIDTAGNVFLGGVTGYTLTKLTEEYQTIRAVIDFKEQKMSGYDEAGRRFVECDFNLPGADNGTLTYEEWFEKLEGVLWQFYSEKVAGGAELRIANITLIAGNTAERGVTDMREIEAGKFEELKNLISEQRDKITAENLFGSSTADMNTAGGEGKMNKWGEVPCDPIDEHPRLYITRDMLPAIRASIEKQDEKTKSRFNMLLISELLDGGVLPEAEYKSTNATVDIDNIHNFDANYLEIIQAKALGYLLYDNEYYGYQAIYYMKNYLDSLDIVQIGSDQAREYGAVMHTAAIVYDWCYPLLTEEDKEQFIAGVENRICRHENVMGSAIEYGFPPYGGGSVNGHSSEKMILRDYFAFATAIFDENESWWDYIGARVCNDFAPVRNYYFQAGVVHQGTGYTTTRHAGDLFSDWIIRVATGGYTPYNDYIKTALKGMLGYECATDMIFNDGDGTGDYKATDGYMHLVFIVAYLYSDSEMLAHGRDMLGTGSFNNNYHSLTSVLYLTLVGLSDIEPAEDKYASMDLIQYNGHPLGQYIIREAWNTDDSAAVIMRIKERTTANHEHRDSGTFEIYYKGALSTDGGCYNHYGHFHTQQYHQSTISHNGLIIFNPSKWNYNSSDAATKWYSGSQRPLQNASNLDKLLDSVNDFAVLTARQHGYSDVAEKNPLYAYIAGDLTQAYYADTVDYVARRMLTVYTGDEDFPMVFFVFDDVSSVTRGKG